MKRNIIILISVLLFSCEIEEINEPYYNFNNSDLNKSLNLELNETIKFKNQLDEYISYNVNEVPFDYKKSWTNGGSFVINWVTVFFHYDKKEIKLYSNSADNVINYQFSRLPIDIEQAEKNRFTKFPSKFNGRIYFSLWNGINENGDIIIDYESETQSMILNTVNYQNVIKIESGNPNPIINTSKNVNVIYYDINYGIIGYDDLDNNQWRISN